MGYWKYIGLDIEMWNKKDSGVVKNLPLLLQANLAGKFGRIDRYREGSVNQSLFTFLCGKPSESFIGAHPELFYNQWLVCMSSEWEEYLRKQPLEMVLRRMLMKPLCQRSEKELPALPEGCVLSSYTPELFAGHPFGHGANYADFADFSEHGAGAVVLAGDKVVASASSFLTFGQEVELDVSVLPEYRRKGLADHCIAQMMSDCAARGLTVHWDAQNIPSYNLAKAHGFVLEQDYAVYVLATSEK